MGFPLAGTEDVDQSRQGGERGHTPDNRHHECNRDTHGYPFRSGSVVPRNRYHGYMPGSEGYSTRSVSGVPPARLASRPAGRVRIAAARPGWLRPAARAARRVGYAAPPVLPAGSASASRRLRGRRVGRPCRRRLRFPAAALLAAWVSPAGPVTPGRSGRTVQAEPGGSASRRRGAPGRLVPASTAVAMAAGRSGALLSVPAGLPPASQAAGRRLRVPLPIGRYIYSHRAGPERLRSVTAVNVTTIRNTAAPPARSNSSLP